MTPLAKGVHYSFYISSLKIECLLPSAAFFVNESFYTRLVNSFVENIGISPPLYGRAFNPGVGSSFVTLNNAEKVSEESISSFLEAIGEIFKNKGDLDDDLYISLSEFPGEASKYPGEQIFPEGSKNHKIGKGGSLSVEQPITIEEGSGLIIWDKDTFSKDDPLFSIIPNVSLCGDNCDLIYNAAEDCLYRVTWTCSANTLHKVSVKSKFTFF